MIKKVRSCISDHIKIVDKLIFLDKEVVAVSNKILACFRNEGKLIFLGNGGSAVDAMHLAAEYVARFYKVRKSLPAVALSSNVAIITAIANDSDYKYVFSRQLESLANKKDIIIALTTSGESKNVVEALKYCRKNNIKTISFTGDTDNTVSKFSDLSVKIPSKITCRIQEAYLLLNHIICELVEDEIVKNK